MAAVASRSSNTASMSSPKRSLPLKHDDNSHKSSPLQQARRLSPPRQDAPPAADNSQSKAETKPGATSTTAAPSAAQPLAPPPRPASEAADYFNQSLSGTHHLSNEANPFEHAFGASSIDTPGKSLLPSVAALASPSSLLPGGTPGWAGSLRSGPLSPAMLTGPTGQSDYFDPHFRGSFPTPNESSMRTGLTPGGGGSMFPAPSPNSQALFQSLQSGGATPSTLDFHRTALSAAAQAKVNNFAATSNPAAASTQAAESAPMAAVDTKPVQAPAVQQTQADPFGQHDADAANSLFLLTQANGNRANGQYNAPAPSVHSQNNTHQMPNHMGVQSQNTSPTTKRAMKNSIGSITGSADTGDYSDSENEQQTKPTTRSRGSNNKKTGGKAASNSNARRKASETPAKAPASKKAKIDPSMDQMDMDDNDSDNEEMSPKGENGRKMTDEEKRKNFLERNRVAALKCRQRKKQWLANLQAKVEIFSAENDQLSASVTQLREEIVNLKTLLLAHKDCPVSSQQGLQGNAMVAFVNGVNGAGMEQAPYGMGMGPPPNGMMMSVGGHPGMGAR